MEDVIPLAIGWLSHLVLDESVGTPVKNVSFVCVCVFCLMWYCVLGLVVACLSGACASVLVCVNCVACLQC